MDEDTSDEPSERRVVCPECGDDTYAVVPQNTRIVDDANNADGKVRVNCIDCESRFIAYFQNGA